MKEEALLRKYNLPPDTNRDVLYRVLASLDGGGGAARGARASSSSVSAAPPPQPQAPPPLPPRAMPLPLPPPSPPHGGGGGGGCYGAAPSENAYSDGSGGADGWQQEGSERHASASASAGGTHAHAHHAHAAPHRGGAAMSALDSEHRVAELQNALARRTAQLRNAEARTHTLSRARPMPQFACACADPPLICAPRFARWAHAAGRAG
jgi:hypothetical protein